MIMFKALQTTATVLGTVNGDGGHISKGVIAAMIGQALDGDPRVAGIESTGGGPDEVVITFASGQQFRVRAEEVPLPASRNGQIIGREPLTKSELLRQLTPLYRDSEGFDAGHRREVVAMIGAAEYLNEQVRLPYAGGTVHVTHERLARPHFERARNWYLDLVPAAGQVSSGETPGSGEAGSA